MTSVLENSACTHTPSLPPTSPVMRYLSHVAEAWKRAKAGPKEPLLLPSVYLEVRLVFCPQN